MNGGKEQVTKIRHKIVKVVKTSPFANIFISSFVMSICVFDFIYTFQPNELFACSVCTKANNSWNMAFFHSLTASLSLILYFSRYRSASTHTHTHNKVTRPITRDKMVHIINCHKNIVNVNLKLISYHFYMLVICKSVRMFIEYDTPKVEYIAKITHTQKTFKTFTFRTFVVWLVLIC